MYNYVYTVLELLIKLGLFWFAKHAVNINKPGWHDHPHRSNYLFYHFSWQAPESTMGACCFAATLLWLASDVILLSLSLLLACILDFKFPNC